VRGKIGSTLKSGWNAAGFSVGGWGERERVAEIKQVWFGLTHSKCSGWWKRYPLEFSGLVWPAASAAESVFVNLLRCPGIDSWPGGLVRHPICRERPDMLQMLTE
jgi:hypothetical protein